MFTYIIPAAAAAIAFLLGWLLHKMLVNKEIGGATTEAERILAEARRESETLRKEIILEGREQINEERTRELSQTNQELEETLEKLHASQAKMVGSRAAPADIPNSRKEPAIISGISGGQVSSGWVMEG